MQLLQVTTRPDAMVRSTRLRAMGLAVCMSLWLSVGCQPPNFYQPPPPPSVTVSQPKVQTITNFQEETGTTEAVEFVEIRARVKGFLEKIHFAFGDIVEEGQLLYEIEPQPFEAVLNQRRAALETTKTSLKMAEAELKNAEARYQRAEALAKTRVMTTEERDERLAERDVAKAAISAAKATIAEAQAAVDAAALELSYTKVTSPVTGRAGRTLVTQGNLVGDAEATHLTTIVKYDPIYATFNISERVLLKILDKGPNDRKEEVDKQSVKMYLARDGDEGFPFEGHLDYADLAVDHSTGTFMIRGVFPNPDQRIIPGLFVRIRIPVDTTENALLVSESAIGNDQQGRYLLVVNSENVVEKRLVDVGEKVDDHVAVLKGLQQDDWVVISGIQRARPGATVKPKRMPPTQSLAQATPGDEKASGHADNGQSTPGAEIAAEPN